MSKEQDTIKTIYNILLEYINEPKDKHTYSYWECADVLDDVKEIVKDLKLYKKAFEIMTDNKHNAGRRQFLKSLGLGGASMFGLMAMEPFQAVAKAKQTDVKGGAEDKKMPYRVNRSTNDTVSLLGYGMMRLPFKDKQIDQEEVNREVDYAIAHGVNYFDTAYIYPGSEAALGEVLARNNCRDQIYIATKLPHYLML